MPAALAKFRPRYRPPPRQNAAKRGYDSKWQKARAEYLKQNPWCVECAKKNKRTPATVVDHVIAHKGNKKLFWSRSNWAASCVSHNSSKSAAREGGFGNPIR